MPPRGSKQSNGERGSGYPESVERLIAAFGRLPGIGRRSAERLAFHILKSVKDEALGLARAIEDVKKQVKYCPVCFNFADGERCAICADEARERACVLVVEQPKDLIAIEQTGQYRGVYHVLLGRLSPLEGLGPESITASRLVERVTDPSRNAGGERVTEIVLGLSPTLEGDGTALYLADELGRVGGAGVKVTRLARGLPSGREIEFAGTPVLAEAIRGRRPFEERGT